MQTKKNQGLVKDGEIKVTTQGKKMVYFVPSEEEAEEV